MPSLLVHVVFIWLLVGVFPLAAVGQAPGDEDPFCKDSRCNAAPTYPNNVTILMDSRNYAYLIGGVWDQLERDGDADVQDICSYNRWRPTTTKICCQQVQVCGYRQNVMQDNWLFTQYISKNNSAENSATIFIDITYQIGTECKVLGLGCKREFELYYYAVNSKQSREGYHNITRYTRLSTISPGDSQFDFVNEELGFTLSPQQSGFYIAIRDYGTCMFVSRITVYRYNVAVSTPGDADFRCIHPTATDPSFQPYPEDQRILFDTWNYERLLGSGGVLQVLNNDGGNGWIPQPSICREKLRVCDYEQPTQPQNNWVFTQYISYREAIEVNVDVTYDYTSCITNQGNGCNTLQTTMYRYERNGVDNTARTNPDNYLPNSLQVLSAAGSGTFTRSFTFQPSGTTTGFYLGVQDTGTCGTINRITVYYRICPGETQGLVTFPETPLPPAGASQPNTRSGTCAANSSPTFTNPIYRAFADGRCETSAFCTCNPGFQVVSVGANRERCQACPAGTYRSASDPAISCLGCPEKTDVTRVIAPNCGCLVGYYRTRTEGAGVRCTSPPSACTNLAVQSKTSSSAIIRWNRPETVGRPDYYYNVYVSDPDRVNTFIQDNSQDYVDGRSRPTYSVSGLRPHTSYVIRVSVHNGVSDQDPNEQMRQCEVNVMTDSAAPGPPSNPRGLCTVVVWQQPEQSNGVISGYEIRFFRGGTRGTIISKGRDELFHVVEDGNIPSGGSGSVTFQVRAKNLNGRLTGPWTMQASLGCSGSIPTESPVPSPIYECETNNGGCQQICTNTQGGSRECSCRSGFTLASDGRNCRDIGRTACDINNGGCSQMCTNTPGSRRCSCRPGFMLTSNGRNCKDINECNTNNGGCSQMCTNTQGSRVCSCRTGYRLDSDGRTCLDINECNTNNGGCSQICTNTQGSRVCSCRFRFILASDGRTCQGISGGDCNIYSGGCEQICTNTPGSSVCSCRSGFTLASNGRNCQDINECNTNNGGCSQRCSNIPGSRVCSCRPGFVLDTDGRTCLDINECNINNGGCDQICTNAQGAHQCSCRLGYTLAGDGRRCHDHILCVTNNGSCSQICTFTQGLPKCSCRTGYRLASDGITCQDINECNTNNGGCQQLCINTRGSRECGCRPGFTLDSDGVTCIESLTVSISVEYDPPDCFTPGPNDYRAASGPVTVTCTATGPRTGTVSYQWSSTCRDCPFQSSTSRSIRRAAVHSGDSGTDTCVVTTVDGLTGRASIIFNVVDAGMQLFRGAPRGDLPNNGLAISENVGSRFRLRIFCRSDSMSENVGQFIGLSGNALTSNSFFAISHLQPGELTIENIVGSQSTLTAIQQGVYTCRIPLESGVIRELNVGIYPSGFNTPPSIVGVSSARLGSLIILTCNTTGSPATKVRWHIDGNTVIIDGSTYQQTQTVTNRVSSTYENVLTINGRISGSTFTCTVQNALGSVTSALISI